MASSTRLVKLMWIFGTFITAKASKYLYVYVGIPVYNYINILSQTVLHAKKRNIYIFGSFQ